MLLAVFLNAICSHRQFLSCTISRFGIPSLGPETGRIDAWSILASVARRFSESVCLRLMKIVVSNANTDVHAVLFLEVQCLR